tara:strand:+ start:1045 stop:1173 length:129 start_codon:yes stop_codon:yes gene_type:complete
VIIWLGQVNVSKRKIISNCIESEDANRRSYAWIHDRKEKEKT